MIIAIDEAGDFSKKSKLINIFVAVYIRKSGTIYDSIKRRFLKWESGIDDMYRHKTGEIKGKLLPDKELFNCIKKIFRKRELIGITAVGLSASINPENIIEKHRNVQIGGIGEGIIKYKQVGNEEMVKEVTKMYHWFRKLSYVQYMKIIALGNCIYDALYNSIGFSFVNKFDKELADISYKIDEDFLTNEKQKTYWRKLLQDILRHLSSKNPLIIPDVKQKDKHPFFRKYVMNGNYDLSELFTKRLDFFNSSENFEIRIADIVATILHRYFNHKKKCKEANNIIKQYYWHPKDRPFYIIKLANEGYTN